MDRFKFRVWDKENERFLDSLNWNINGMGDLFCRGIYKEDKAISEGVKSYDKFEVLKSTGLKDKNGKLIFEGDVMKGESHTATVLGKSAKSNRTVEALFEVKWINSYWGEWTLHAITVIHRTFPRFEDSEIIGNIYENPELLTKGE